MQPVPVCDNGIGSLGGIICDWRSDSMRCERQACGVSTAKAVGFFPIKRPPTTVVSPAPRLAARQASSSAHAAHGSGAPASQDAGSATDTTQSARPRSTRRTAVAATWEAVGGLATGASSGIGSLARKASARAVTRREGRVFTAMAVAAGSSALTASAFVASASPSVTFSEATIRRDTIKRQVRGGKSLRKEAGALTPWINTASLSASVASSPLSDAFLGSGRV